MIPCPAASCADVLPAVADLAGHLVKTHGVMRDTADRIAREEAGQGETPPPGEIASQNGHVALTDDPFSRSPELRSERAPEAHRVVAQPRAGAGRAYQPKEKPMPRVGGSIPCSHPGCDLTFSKVNGLSRHLRGTHGATKPKLTAGRRPIKPPVAATNGHAADARAELSRIVALEIAELELEIRILNRLRERAAGTVA